ncbi:MAG TPA: hypothetical protein VF191_09345 [Cyclobacteriaceae bacterium]
MTKLRTLKILFLVSFAFSAFGQKVKYKDIYSLLSTKQYDAAEPFLKRYLVDEQENPNAFLFMGIIYQEKAAACHVLRETQSLVSYADSAIHCFDKTVSLLTERELKRNAEYYQAYNRRDLRTGEFGIALSDIQFDLQKRKEALLTRSAAAKMIRHHFESADSLYGVCTAAYQTLTQSHPTEADLFLRASDSTVALLDNLASKFDAAVKAIRLYQSSMTTPGVPAYRHDFKMRPIADYPTEGSDRVDFSAEEVGVWDYGAFAADVRKKITEDIRPLQEQTLKHLTLLFEMATDPTSHANMDVSAPGADRFRRYDGSDPFPPALARLLAAATIFRDRQRQPAADSINAQLMLQDARDDVRALELLDSAVHMLRERDLTKAVHQYAFFLPPELREGKAVEALMDSISTAADAQRQHIHDSLVASELAAHRLRVGEEFIPLSNTDTLNACRPLLTIDERYTVGVKAIDSVSVAGYFYSITPSRIPDVAATFELDTAAFGTLHWPSVKALSTDANDLVYYVLIYADKGDWETYPARVAKIYRVDGLSWTTDLQLGFAPELLEYQPDTGTLVVRGEDTLIIDKNGNPK